MQQRLLDLILYKTYAELKFEAQRTYVGVLWWILEPVLFMLIYYFVFGVLLDRATENFVPFLLVGLTTFHWMQSTVIQASWSIIANKPLIQQVHVPKFVFPTVVILTTTAKFVIVFVLLVIYLAASGIPFTVATLQCAVPLLNFLLLTTAFAMLAGAFTPFIPDARLLIDNAFRGVFFLSGIFFDISAMPEHLASILWLNPIAILIHDLRETLIHGQSPAWGNEAAIAAFGALLLAISLAFIRTHEHRYAKVAV